MQKLAEKNGKITYAKSLQTETIFNKRREKKLKRQLL